MMNHNSQAILLLTARFGPSKGDALSPLAPAEYGRLADWLRKHDHEPCDLLRHPEEVLADWSDSRDKITTDRIETLLNRGMAMGVALEKWQGAGLWILTRADSEYPNRLRMRLGKNAPAVLFGAGNQRLLNAGGLAMVGSREIDNADQEYVRQIAAQAAQEGMNVVSGGARGVDEIAMKAALEVEGTALGILANGLLKAALSSKWRTYIKRRQLCLVSSYYPEAGFDVGNAMGRNKYIYCLSNYALVVQSAKGKGGTWAGATESLKNRWVKTFVQGESASPGLEALANLGASRLRLRRNPISEEEWLRAALEPAESVREIAETTRVPQERFYALFLERVVLVLDEIEQVSLVNLKEHFPDFCQKQITEWLDRAVEEGHLTRLGKPRTYSLQKHASRQRSLFDDN